MDDQTACLPAVIVLFRHPSYLEAPVYLTRSGLRVTYSRASATRYATESTARRAMRTAIRDLRLDAWPGSLETA